jgi:hypothetical protein
VVNQASEQCDAGGNSATCDADCTTRICGDGFINPAAGEVCDPGPDVEFCTLGSGNEDPNVDQLTNCDDVRDCPVTCDIAVACVTNADCPASQSNGKWAGKLPPSECVANVCRIYCAQDTFCKRNPNIPGSTGATLCGGDPTCAVGCGALETACNKLGDDPAMIRFATREGELDTLKMHAYIPVDEANDPAKVGFAYSIYNVDGVVYELQLGAGDLVARGPGRRAYYYKDASARLGSLPANGIERLRLRKRQRDGRSVYTFRLEARADLSNATKALMTTQVAIGRDGAALQSLWRRTPYGWALYRVDLF